MAATYHAGYGWPVDDQPRETIAAVVLAAGEGRRFGGPKQLHVIEGITMLERVLIAVERSGIATRLVVLGARAERITAEVPLHGAIAVRVTALGGWAGGIAENGPGGAAGTRSTRRSWCWVTARGSTRGRSGARRPPGTAFARRTTAADARTRSCCPAPAGRRCPRPATRPARDLEARLIDCRGLPEPGDVDYAAP